MVQRARVADRLDGAVDNPEYDPALLTVADGERDAEITYAGNGRASGRS